jgi:hypothetical protein
MDGAFPATAPPPPPATLSKSCSDNSTGFASDFVFSSLIGVSPFENGSFGCDFADLVHEFLGSPLM